jgi:hypothetical protein
MSAWRWVVGSSHTSRRLSPARRSSHGRALMEMMRDIGGMVAIVVSSFDYPLHVSCPKLAIIPITPVRK